MNLGNKLVISAALLSWTSLTFASPMIYAPEYYQIKRVEIKEIAADGNDLPGHGKAGDIRTSVIAPELPTTVPGAVVPGVDGRVTLDQAGKVIQVVKDLVALGEDIYKLITKGKPSVKTDYAPISVVTKDASGNAIDVMDMEDWSVPKSKKYQVVYKNGFGLDVVKFEYMILFTYGGTYNSTGAYLTGLQIIPTKVKVSYGFDFSATYKLQSIANHGKRDNPVAGAVIVLQYSVSNMLGVEEMNDTFHITGKGEIKDYL